MPLLLWPLPRGPPYPDAEAPCALRQVPASYPD